MNGNFSFAPLLRQLNACEDHTDDVLNGMEFFALKRLIYQLGHIDLHDNICDIHHHTLFEVHVIRSGYQEYLVDDQSFVLGSGEFLLIPPSVPHGVVRESTDLQKFALLFSLPVAGTACLPAALVEQLKQAPYTTGKAQTLMIDILDFVFESIPLRGMHSAENLRSALSIFMRELSSCLRMGEGIEDFASVELDPLSQTDSDFCERVADYIKNNLSSLSLEKVAAQFFISSRHLNRKLQSHFGMSYCQLVDKLRLSHARNLLCYTDLSVESIAYQVGSSNPSNFIRFFKRMEGVSPTDYRKSFHELSKES